MTDTSKLLIQRDSQLSHESIRYRNLEWKIIAIVTSIYIWMVTLFIVYREKISELAEEPLIRYLVLVVLVGTFAFNVFMQIFTQSRFIQTREKQNEIAKAILSTDRKKTKLEWDVMESCLCVSPSRFQPGIIFEWRNIVSAIIPITFIACSGLGLVFSWALFYKLFISPSRVLFMSCC